MINLTRETFCCQNFPEQSTVVQIVHNLGLKFFGFNFYTMEGWPDYELF